MKKALNEGVILMDFKQLYIYEGKNVVITGAALGIARAMTELLIEIGAKVYALDINEVKLPVTKSYKVNMGIKEQIDQVIEQLPETIDAVFNCHGIAAWPGKEVEVVTINYISQRYLSEQLLPRIPEGGSVTFIASDDGYGWEKNRDKLSEFLALDTFESNVHWVKQNVPYIKEENSFVFSKKAIFAYVKSKVWSQKYIAKRVHINCISPSYTKTGLTTDFEKATEQSAALVGFKIDAKEMIENIFKRVERSLC